MAIKKAVKKTNSATSKTVNVKNVTKRAKQQAKKQVKKKPWLIVLAFVLALGAVGGFFGAGHITKNDVFEVVGDKTVYLQLGQTYQDEGAKAISFGKDVSEKIKSENNINFTVAGEYYIKYTIEDIRFGNVCRYRYVIISEVNNEG